MLGLWVDERFFSRKKTVICRGHDTSGNELTRSSIALLLVLVSVAAVAAQTSNGPVDDGRDRRFLAHPDRFSDGWVVLVGRAHCVNVALAWSMDV
jgi:hypothetical protein